MEPVFCKWLTIDEDVTARTDRPSFFVVAPLHHPRSPSSLCSHTKPQHNNNNTTTTHFYHTQCSNRSFENLDFIRIPYTSSNITHSPSCIVHTLCANRAPQRRRRSRRRPHQPRRPSTTASLARPTSVSNDPIFQARVMGCDVLTSALLCESGGGGRALLSSPVRMMQAKSQKLEQTPHRPAQSPRRVVAHMAKTFTFATDVYSRCFLELVLTFCRTGHTFRKNTAGTFGPDLAKKLSTLVKMEKNVMRSMELVGKERMEVAVCLHLDRLHE
jgi:hypothetical protein